MVPWQHSTGGKDRLGRISKQGNRDLRWLLVAWHGGHPLCTPARHETAMACSPDGTQAGQGRCRRTRQQNRTHGWCVESGSTSRSCCRRNRCRRREGSYDELARHDDVMQIRSFRGSGEPAWGGPSCEAHLLADKDVGIPVSQLLFLDLTHRVAR
ncbi:MAG: transposase [Rhodoplanes sp.]